MSSVATASLQVLVVCDMQPDLLGSIVPASKRDALIDRIQIGMDVARRAGWKIVHMGVRFPSSYQGVPPHHKIYGGFQRLNAKLGNDAAHWFLEGYPGSEMMLYEEGDTAVWRPQHLPTQELIDQVLGCKTNDQVAASTPVQATVVGIKAGYAVQAVTQSLSDAGIAVYVVRDCVQDDDEKRCDAVMDHLIPVYGSVVTLAELIDVAVGLDQYKYQNDEDGSNDGRKKSLQLYSFCGRGGHASLYLGHLTENWQQFPTQPWEWLDEKEKVVQLSNEFMPKTYRLEFGKWVDDEPNSDATPRLWFLKETDKNGGRAVQAFLSAAECLEAALPDGRYVVQPHVSNPLLTVDGHKCHLKQYAYLQCSAGGENATWDLFTHRHPFLSIAPHPWSPTDTSRDTQVTILRDLQLKHREHCDVWSGWPTAYESCQQIMVAVVGRAVEQRKLLPRPNQKQFELFSADFMIDESGRAWLLEFNFTPVLFDPLHNQDLTIKGLVEYHRRYREFDKNDARIINDHDMIRGALSLAINQKPSKDDGWDALSTFSYSGSLTK
ncbi:hypothetical protein MHU86_25188 [Fragilaria crotonensis]|nr:hypothetical protein MHU86_25188 [Fragilaria crotonensis]